MTTTPAGRGASCRSATGPAPVLRASFACVAPASHGEMVVLEEDRGHPSYVVAWRRDRRFSRNVVRLSAAADRSAAIGRALGLSFRYVPPRGPHNGLPRDAARRAVYAWEAAMSGPRHAYGSIEAARADALAMASMLGLTAPHVGPGGIRLVSCSYFSPTRGIVLAADMQDRVTLVHEMAHFLVWRMCIREASHGPAFAAVLAFLHVGFMDTPEARVLGLATDHGIGLNRDLYRGLRDFRRRAA